MGKINEFWNENTSNSVFFLFDFLTSNEKILSLNDLLSSIVIPFLQLSI